MIEELVSRVFAARDIAHREHLSTGSYAQHMALGSFYEDVVAAVDEIVEVYQGAFGKIGHFDVTTEPVEDIASYLQAEAEWIEDNREEIANASNTVENLVDSLVAIYMRTVYKLENLR